MRKLHTAVCHSHTRNQVCDDCWTMLSTPSMTGEYQQLSANNTPTGEYQQLSVNTHTQRIHVEGHYHLPWSASTKTVHAAQRQCRKYKKLAPSPTECPRKSRKQERQAQAQQWMLSTTKSMMQRKNTNAAAWHARAIRTKHQYPVGHTKTTGSPVRTID
jgi:hypothetical protein